MATPLTTYTWQEGTHKDWTSLSNTGNTSFWSQGGVYGTHYPSNPATDAALFTQSPAGSAYIVTVGRTDNIAINTLEFDSAGGTAGNVWLDVYGSLTTTNLLNLSQPATTTTGGQTHVYILDGATFYVDNNGSGSFQSPNGAIEYINIYGKNVSAPSTLRLHDNSPVPTSFVFSFDNHGPTTPNSGRVTFDTAIPTGTSGGTTTYTYNETFQNVAWNDDFTLGGISYVSGATATYNGGTHTLTILDGTNTINFTNFFLLAGAAPTFQVNAGAGGAVEFNPTCFVRGTRIRTPAGEVAIERLRPGDLVCALEDGAPVARPVKWRGHRRIDLRTHPRPETAAPVRIRAGAFADGLPRADLLVSPDHALFVDGKLIAARQLVNHASIVEERGWTVVDYFHIELDRHGVVLAEDLPAESYLDTGNRGFFENGGAPLILHPDLSEDRSALGREAGACAAFAVDEPSVRPVWQRLAERAAALGLAAPERTATSDPALRLVAKGRTIRPVFAEAGLVIFPLPLGATGARLLSRAAAPAATRPWLDDRRTLGVPVKRIVLRTATDAIDIPLDGPALSEGWWEPEAAGEEVHRWTNGAALLTLPAQAEHAMLELHLRGAMEYPVETEKAA